MRNGDAANTKFICFGLTRRGPELTIYHTHGERGYHYITDAGFYATKIGNVSNVKRTIILCSTKCCHYLFNLMRKWKCVLVQCTMKPV